MFDNEQKKQKDCKFGGASRSSIASSTSSTSRIFLQAIDDTFTSRVPMMSADEPEIDNNEFQRQLKLINKHFGSPDSTLIPKNTSKQTINDSDFEAKFTALEFHLKEELAKKTEKYDRDFVAFNKLVDSTTQMKAEIGALEGNHKKLKERIDVLMNMQNRSLEFAKICFNMKKEFHEFKTTTNKELEELRAIVGLSKTMQEMKL